MIMSIFAAISDLIYDEDGQWPGGTLGLIAIILVILCALVFLIINVDVDVK